ncbi:GlxA family transcriptional regulator [Pseudofrankia inefficax]|uniref:Transcriptional regulator, AraC family n=1 Tax=Pseudofrankia inefficax (strain DSM 45817 / CECT 9037 / DDB 130130 / EuI1c) TaxID=298654 RepID=E3J1L5_PSEI1|nr:helix-turn-helix domain-containing protein [Pseudofrankia inefficax]ADP81683.1 transcriptional regulator, AraC family [Pseudofrankia inefficax]
MTTGAASRLVAVLAVDGVVPFDLAVPVEVFGRARLADGSAAYRVVVCAARPGADVDAGTFTLRARHGLDVLAAADTVVVPGTGDVGAPVDPAVLDALRAAAAGADGRGGARVASICSGAFILAAAGLLDGQRATTHWLGAAQLAARYPTVDVDPDVLFVDNGGRVLTSAGAAAGLDLCLHLVRADFGSAVAADAARLSVMPLERAGGQAQFITHQPPAPDGVSLEPLLRWLTGHLDEELTLVEMAREAALSTRTLSRRFREQTGTTPAQWLAVARLRRAQQLLESTDHPVEWVAARVGFRSPAAFRDRFRRLVGTSPQAYRRAFRSPEAARAA